MNKSTKILVTISLLTVLSLSAFVGAVGAFIPGQTPSTCNKADTGLLGTQLSQCPTQYAISEGTGSTDNMVQSAATAGGANWQYSYDVNQFGCEAIYEPSTLTGPIVTTWNAAECTQLPGYSASPVCSVAQTDTDYCNYDQPSYALPPGSNVVFNANKTLRIAMDQYGEFISTKLGSLSNSGTCAASVSGSTCGVAGLAYGSNEAGWQATESFASTGISPAYYIQGWTFDMNYSHVGYPEYSISAYALFSNQLTTEGGRGVWSWDSSVYSGNTACPIPALCSSLTAGVLIPSGIKVLYDDQRLSIFQTTITIQDSRFNAPVGENVSQITLTTVFNKDTKDVIVYKDLKILLSPKVLTNIGGIAFSERYELDLAHNINTGNAAYIHYYHSSGTNQTTVYQHPLTGGTTYDVVNAFDPLNQVNFFAAYWPSATQFTVYDPRIIPGLDTPTASGCTNYPSCTGALPTPTKIHDVGGVPIGSCTLCVPGPLTEPKTPWIVVQWMFQQTQYPNLLAWLETQPGALNQREIRFVEVLGMTDLNSGTGSGTNPYPSKDANAAVADATYGTLTGTCSGPKGLVGCSPVNEIGVEVQYLLQQIFNPESLNTINGQTAVTMYSDGVSEYQDCYSGASYYRWSSESPTFYNFNCNHPLLWTGVGQSSAAVDSAGATLISAMQRNQFYASSNAISYPAPFALLDKNSSSPNQGSIPFALCELLPATYKSSAALNGINGCAGTTNVYTYSHNNAATKTGLDTTTLYSTYMQNFYDNNTESILQVQPIHGGCVSPPVEGYTSSGYLYNYSWWMPAKSPFTESWYVYNYGSPAGTPDKPTCSTYDDSPVSNSNSPNPTYGGLYTEANLLPSYIISNQEGIATVGGPKANLVTGYFNDWNFALDRDGTTPYANIGSSGVVQSGTSTPTNTGGTLDFFPISTWATTPVSSVSAPNPGTNPYTWYSDTNNTVGFAVISIARDTIGLRGLSVYGWNGRDTYWASAWVSQWLAEYNGHYNNPFYWLPQGTVSIILEINYQQSTKALSTWEPMNFNIVKALGTITELGFNQFISTYGTFDTVAGTTWTSYAGLAPVSADPGYGSTGNVLDLANNVNLYECNNPVANPDGYLSILQSPAFSWFSPKLPTCTSASVQYN